MNKISIITISFNAVNEIEKTILSVINQTYNNIEYIVIDGGSTDGTVNIIHKYLNRIAYFKSEPDKGIYDAMNKGIRVATGKWINFMNAGDYFFKNNTIEELMLSVAHSMDYDVIYGYLVHSYQYGNYIRKKIPLSLFPICMPFGHAATFVKTNLMKKMGFDCNYHIAADYDFFYKIYAQGACFYSSNTIVAVFESSEGISNSLKYASLTIKETAIVNGSFGSWSYYKTIGVAKVIFLIKRVFQSTFPSKYVLFLKKKRERHPEFIPLEDFIIERNAHAKSINSNPNI